MKLLLADIRPNSTLGEEPLKRGERLLAPPACIVGMLSRIPAVDAELNDDGGEEVTTTLNRPPLDILVARILLLSVVIVVLFRGDPPSPDVEEREWGWTCAAASAASAVGDALEGE